MTSNIKIKKFSHFWNSSLTAYAQPEVPQACLLHQDQYSLDVNLILFCCWYGSTHGYLTKDEFDLALAFSISWTNHVVHPLRKTRKWMKQTGPKKSCMSESAFTTLRNEIKKSELAAEHIQQDALENLISKPPVDLKTEKKIINMAKNLSRYLSACNVQLSIDALSKLAHIITAFVADSEKENVFITLKKYT